jgi:ATP-binding cassette subfamily F protein 3
MLFINDLTYRIAGRTLLEKTSLSIPAGHRVGLVGPNGTGKSTLFKLINGELANDGGDISMIKGASLGWVRQHIEDDSMSLIDIVLAADTERTELLLEAETVTDPDRMGYIYDRLAEIDAYGAPSRAASILSGLGFNDSAQQRPISEFSGGWQARVALAAALFRQPNLLLLDEPTNHLDFEAMIWLENFLMRYKETLIIISHDRDILNKTVTQIVHLENQQLTLYTGNYDQFERKRAERLMGQQALHEKQMAQKAHMMKFVERFGATASKARQAQSRLKMIEKMDIVDAVMAERVTQFRFPEPEELKSPLITLEDVDAGYDGRAVLKKLSLRIDQDDRIALLGANGNGKSTLVKLLSGRLDPMSGEIHKSGKLRVGYFAQFQTDELDVTQTPYEVLRAAMKGVAEAKIRASLGKFGFDKFKADTKVGELSGGEKARLLFCLMSFDAPHIMLLDEPTNHLDIDAREALMRALNEYNGAVIIVSHDPHLVASVADRLWLVADHTCKSYDGDLDDYRELVVKQRKQEREQEKKKNKNKPEHATETKTLSKAEKEAARIETKIAELTLKKDAVENEIANVCASGDTHQLKDLNITHAQLEKKLAEQTRLLDELISKMD